MYAFGIYACLDFDGLRDPQVENGRVHIINACRFLSRSRGEIYYNTRPANS